MIRRDRIPPARSSSATASRSGDLIGPAQGLLDQRDRAVDQEPDGAEHEDRQHPIGGAGVSAQVDPQLAQQESAQGCGDERTKPEHEAEPRRMPRGRNNGLGSGGRCRGEHGRHEQLAERTGPGEEGTSR